MTNTEKTIARIVAETASSNVVTQLEAMLSIARQSGINIEALELSCAGSFARIVAEYAERSGKSAQLGEVLANRASAGPQLDYSRFSPDYIRRCRGLAAGGAMYLGRKSSS